MRHRTSGTNTRTRQTPPQSAASQTLNGPRCCRRRVIWAMWHGLGKWVTARTFWGGALASYIENAVLFNAFFKAPDVDPPPGFRWDRIRTNPPVARSRWFKPEPMRHFLPRELHPISEMAYQHRPNRCFPAVGDLTPKARKMFFTKVLSRQRAHFHLYIAGPGVSMRTLLQS